MTKKSSLLVLLFAVLCSSYTLYCLIFKTGRLSYAIQTTTLLMFFELFVLLVISLIGVEWNNVFFLFLELVIFAYLHTMFLPLLYALAYCAVTLLVGRIIRKIIINDYPESIEVDALIGIISLSCLYAILSLIKIGSIPKLRIIVFILFITLACNFLFEKRFDIRNIRSLLTVDTKTYIILCLIMTFVMIIIGRVNLSLDYDSAWYGTRSAFVLDIVTGIYDPIKMIGCVYTYPKGYEIFMLPISCVKSYAFVYSGNIIVTIGILYMCYKICRLFVSKHFALLGCLLLSAIPGVMNMSTTAKPDSLTLFIQMIMMYYSVLFVRDKFNSNYFTIIIAAYIYSLTLKPTSVIFSTSIMIALLFVKILYRIKIKIDKNDVLLLLSSFIILLLVWFRTYLLTGMPAGSIWGRLFRLFGMSEKYPYSMGQISQFRSGGLFNKETIYNTCIRIREFFVAPISEDTDHIIIAWGTSLCTFLIISVVIGGIVTIKKQIKKIKDDRGYLFLLLMVCGELFGCLLCLWVLNKPDGNYFMLFYTVTVIGAIVFFSDLKKSKKLTKEAIIIIMLIFYPTNLFLTGCTNWSWCCQFSAIDWVNRGFWNHQQSFKYRMYDAGCKKIYNILADDPTNKVFAYGIHPDVEQFPCVIESETDVSFWGNSELTSTVDNFIDFIKYENYDYIYIEPGYLNNESNAYMFLCNMFDLSMFKDITVENGYMLLELGDGIGSKNENMKNDFCNTINMN